MMRGARTRPALALFLLLAPACVTKTAVPAGTVILCSGNGECPEGWGCDSDAGFCVKAGEPAARPASSLTARSDAPDAMTLTWADANLHTTGFEISRALAGSTDTPTVLIDDLAATESSYGDSGLQADTAYTYSLVVLTSGGRSRSREVDGWTVPQALADLTVSTVSATELQLQWTDNSDHEEGFLVERSDDGAPFDEVTTVAAGTEDYLDSGLMPGLAYVYRVYVVGPGGRSPAAEAQTRAAFEPVLDWSAPLALDTSCTLTAAGTVTFDTEMLAAVDVVNGDIDGTSNVVADTDGVTGDVTAFDFDAKTLTWSVTDTLGSTSSATRLARILPTSLTDFTAVPNQVGGHVTEGQQHWDESVAVTPGGVQCASCTGPRGSIAVRSEGACVLGDDTGVRCWGRDIDGALGIGEVGRRNMAVDVCDQGTGPDCNGTLTGVRALAGMFDSHCAIMTDGELLCWGRGVSGAIGSGDGESRHRPSPVCIDGIAPDCGLQGQLLNVNSVALGGLFGCAVVNAGPTGQVWCWGASDNNSPLGDGTILVDRFNAGPVCRSGTFPDCTGGERYSDAVTIAVGDNHACALQSDGTAVCWGEQSFGRLGHTETPGGNGSPEPYPVPVCGLNGCPGLLTGIVSLAAGAQFSCALLDDGRVACWGRGVNGVGIGIGVSDDSPTPSLVRCHEGSSQPTPDCEAGTNIQTNVVAIAAGVATACALIDTGELKCWGQNAVTSGGLIGDGTAVSRLSSVYVCESGAGIDCPRLQNVVAVDTSGITTCAMQGAGAVLCWGTKLGLLPVPPCDREAGLGCDGTLHGGVRGCFSFGLEEL